MTQTIEDIDGHRYLVTRDGAGKIAGMEGRDNAATIVSPDIEALLQKASDKWTLADVASALQIVLQRQVK